MIRASSLRKSMGLLPRSPNPCTIESHLPCFGGTWRRGLRFFRGSETPLPCLWDRSSSPYTASLPRSQMGSISQEENCTGTFPGPAVFSSIGSIEGPSPRLTHTTVNPGLTTKDAPGSSDRPRRYLGKEDRLVGTKTFPLLSQGAAGKQRRRT